jgi:hypothetical protein
MMTKQGQPLQYHCQAVHLHAGKAHPEPSVQVSLKPLKVGASVCDCLVRRFNNDGQLSITAKKCISTLAKPFFLNPVHK